MTERLGSSSHHANYRGFPEAPVELPEHLANTHGRVMETKAKVESGTGSETYSDLLAEAKSEVRSHKLDRLDYVDTQADRGAIDAATEGQIDAFKTVYKTADRDEVINDPHAAAELAEHRRKAAQQLALARFPVPAPSADGKVDRAAVRDAARRREALAAVLVLPDNEYLAARGAWEVVQAEQMQREIDNLKEQAYKENRHHEAAGSGRHAEAQVRAEILDRRYGGRLERLRTIPLADTTAPERMQRRVGPRGEVIDRGGDRAMRLVRGFNDIVNDPASVSDRAAAIEGAVAGGMDRARAERAYDIKFARRYAASFETELFNGRRNQDPSRTTDEAEALARLDETDIFTLLTSPDLQRDYQTYARDSETINRYGGRARRVEQALNGRNLAEYALESREQAHDARREEHGYLRRILHSIGTAIHHETVRESQLKGEARSVLSSLALLTVRMRAASQLARETGTSVGRAYSTAVGVENAKRTEALRPLHRAAQRSLIAMLAVWSFGNAGAQRLLTEARAVNDRAVARGRVTPVEK